MNKKNQLIPNDKILKTIIIIRDERVILDVHLAELYSVETRTLKQAVKRNIERFPEDFMFELSEIEMDEVVSQNVIPSKSYFGGAKPYAFTETGVAMLSSVLKSSKAVEMNISIMRTFVALRKLALNYDDLLKKLEALEKGYDGKFKEIYNTLKYLMSPQSKRNPIGYNRNED